MNAVIPYMVLGLVLTGCPSALAGERAAAGSLAGGSSLVGYVPNELYRRCSRGLGQVGVC